MTERSKPIATGPVSGAMLLALSRAGSKQAQSELRAYAPVEIAEGIRELSPKQRVELLELAERLDEIVPLLSEAEFTSTVRTVGLADAGWLVEFASPEQRVAAIDLDCFRNLRLSPNRLFEWIDAMIAAGPETLVAAMGELDPEIWILAMKSMGSFSLVGMGGGDGGGGGDYLTDDGAVAYTPHTAEHEERIREILGTALAYAPAHYWRLVFGAISGSTEENAEFVARWHSGRLADLGFPDRDYAMQAYRPLRADDVATLDLDAADSHATASGPVAADEPSAALPELLVGTLIGRALAALSPARASEVLGYVLAVANTLAVADELPLAEPDTALRSLRKALTGIDRGLRELARRRNEPPPRVLDQTAPLDLFRIGATLDPALGRGRTLLDFEEAEDNGDWDTVFEMIEAADRTIAPDGKPR